jgi:hypothetical protein
VTTVPVTIAGNKITKGTAKDIVTGSGGTISMLGGSGPGIGMVLKGGPELLIVIKK